MKLYFAPRTHSIRPRWLLEELEVPYELVRLDLAKQEHRTPAFLAVSPLGEVPALVDGDLTLLEPAAICLHLADRFPEKQLAPPPGSTERGAYYQALLFAEVTLAPALVAVYEHAQRSEEQRAAAPAQEALARHHARVGALLDVLAAQVEGRDFLVAGRFTAADLVTASLLHLANHLKLLEGRPRLVEYVYLHCQRPAIQRAVL
jgi:glutathione S-transferase